VCWHVAALKASPHALSALHAPPCAWCSYSGARVRQCAWSVAVVALVVVRWCSVAFGRCGAPGRTGRLTSSPVPKLLAFGGLSSIIWPESDHFAQSLTIFTISLDYALHVLYTVSSRGLGRLWSRRQCTSATGVMEQSTTALAVRGTKTPSARRWAYTSTLGPMMTALSGLQPMSITGASIPPIG